MEITRIPNQANVYQKIYTDYADPAATTYLGSTCNVYQCGKTVGDTFYPATHSSITIGSTKYSGADSNLVTGYSGADAIGVSFGALKNRAPQESPAPKNLGSAVIDGMLIQHMKITTRGL